MLCHTVGHSNYDLETFITILKQNDINFVVDVRTKPYSGYCPHFNRDNIRDSLVSNNINYLFMGDQLGGKMHNASLCFDDGIISYDLIRETEDYKTGLSRLIDGINKGYKIVLMCAEKPGFNCHRFMLISRDLKDRGIEVIHINGIDSTSAMEEFESRLLKEHSNDERNLTDYADLKEIEGELARCYLDRNKKMGFNINKKK